MSIASGELHVLVLFPLFILFYFLIYIGLALNLLLGRGGQSVVFLTRDDLQYLLLIEEIVNVKMSELEHKEEDVLLLLNKALTARQIASLVRTIYHDLFLFHFVQAFGRDRILRQGRALRCKEALR